MKNQTIDALSYCFDLLTFVFQNKEAGEKIKSIYLLGSAVRGELQKKSDIDLFVDCEIKDEKTVSHFVNSGIVKFQASKDFQKWKNLHFTYPFSVQVGKLSEWDLKLSILSEGLLLYSRSTNLVEGKRMVLFTLKYPSGKKEYIKTKRLLFGRDEKQFQYKGIVRALNGEKISSHVFMVPKEEQGKMTSTLSKEKINFSMKEITLLES